MVDRCTRPGNKNWKHYGGRGIAVCARWRVFTNFLTDMGEPPKGLSIERINNNGNYEPANCKWATTKEQGRNKRSNKLGPTAVIDIRSRPGRKGARGRGVIEELALEYGVSEYYVRNLRTKAHRYLWS